MSRDGGTPPERGHATGAMKKSHWVLIVTFVIVVWMALMVGASYFGYEYKSPVRIENWKPEPAP
jgi:flagellar basal body-associated protein FliL